jgi:hypothetical protein
MSTHADLGPLAPSVRSLQADCRGGERQCVLKSEKTSPCHTWGSACCTPSIHKYKPSENGGHMQY